MNAIRSNLLTTSFVRPTVEANERHDRAPAWLGWMAVAIAIARTLPFLRALTFRGGPEGWIVPVGYLPQDFLSYVALIRQSAETGSLTLANPYTTAHQDGRYLLLFHATLGWVSRLFGAAPAWLFELSRFPLTIVFFLVLWRFLRPWLPDRRERQWGCALIGLSGGWEGLLKPTTHLWPEFLATRFTEATWHPYGWSTFASLLNPLWTMGLILTLVVLTPVLCRERLRGSEGWGSVSLGYLLLYLVHPYSAIVVAAVVVALPVVEWVFRERVLWSRQFQLAARFAPPAFLLTLIAYWQSGDDVYRATAGHVIGPLGLSVFWYPVTLGAVGILALRGAAAWIDEKRPGGLALLAWIGAVVLLHTSPVINGYHFLFHLHLPLCIVAGPIASRMFTAQGRLTAPHREAREATTYAELPPSALPDQPTVGARARLNNFSTTILLVATFLSPLLLTAESIGDIARRNVRPAGYARVLEQLRDLPAGNVLAPAELGSAIPASTSHRVYVGHWFLTPDYLGKSQEYETLVGDPSRQAEMIELLERERIGYLVVLQSQASRWAERLPVTSSVRCGEYELLVLASRAVAWDSDPEQPREPT